MTDRPDVPAAWVQHIDAALAACPQCAAEPAWTGVRWRVRGSTVAHLFGGEDQLFRVILRAAPDEVMAFEHMGAPYFRVGWGENVVGLVLDDQTDWAEVAELVVDSYLVQAPAPLADEASRAMLNPWQ